MMERIGIIGYGELGKQFENFIQSTYKKSEIIFFDDLAYNCKINCSFPFNSFLDEQFSDCQFLVGLGYKHLNRKKNIIDTLMSNKRKLFTLIHPNTIIDKSASIDLGTVIYPNVTIDKNVCIGKGCLINLSVTISHDTIVGGCCFFAPSVTTSGFVSIGEKVFLGTSVCVANNVKIGDSAIVGIGTVVTRDIEKGKYVLGNPQQYVKDIILI